MCVTCVQVLVRCPGGQNRSLDPLALAGNCELPCEDGGGPQLRSCGRVNRCSQPLSHPSSPCI